MPREACEVKPWLRSVGALLVPLYLLAIWGLPCLCIALAGTCPPALGCFVVLMFPLTYLATACVLSLPHQAHVVEGRMPVDMAVPAYFHRRLYGLCWTAVYYSGPIYHLALSVPLLRRMLFRGFGYRGSLDFTIYPDTWIRDLPLLDFGAGCYLANKATIGSNMIFMRKGKKWIEVAGLSIGPAAMVGHMTIVGPGTIIEEGVQIGVIAGIGRRARIGAYAIIGDGASLDHGVRIEGGAMIKARCYVGMGRCVSATESTAPSGALLR